jgi:hypothetical protein
VYQTCLAYHAVEDIFARYAIFSVEYLLQHAAVDSLRKVHRRGGDRTDSPASGGDAWRLGLTTAVAGEVRFYWVFVWTFPSGFYCLCQMWMPGRTARTKMSTIPFKLLISRHSS